MRKSNKVVAIAVLCSVLLSSCKMTDRSDSPLSVSSNIEHGYSKTDENKTKKYNTFHEKKEISKTFDMDADISGSEISKLNKVNLKLKKFNMEPLMELIGDKTPKEDEGFEEKYTLYGSHNDTSLIFNQNYASYRTKKGRWIESLTINNQNLFYSIYEDMVEEDKNLHKSYEIAKTFMDRLEIDTMPCYYTKIDERVSNGFELDSEDTEAVKEGYVFRFAFPVNDIPTVHYQKLPITPVAYIAIVDGKVELVDVINPVDVIEELDEVDIIPYETAMKTLEKHFDDKKNSNIKKIALEYMPVPRRFEDKEFEAIPVWCFEMLRQYDDEENKNKLVQRETIIINAQTGEVINPIDLNENLEKNLEKELEEKGVKYYEYRNTRS